MPFLAYQFCAVSPNAREINKAKNVRMHPMVSERWRIDCDGTFKRDVRIACQLWGCCTSSRPKVVTMLAEIFLLWLETTSRVSQEAAPASNSRFFLPNGLLGQKRDEENRNDVGFSSEISWMRTHHRVTQRLGEPLVPPPAASRWHCNPTATAGNKQRQLALNG